MEALAHPSPWVELLNALLRPMGVQVPDYLFYCALIVLFLAGIGLFVKSRLSIDNPGKLQIVLEDIVAFIVDTLENMMPHKGKQFLPLVGTILPNPNGQLDNSLFIGKPGWDRYNGTLMQGSVLFDHRFNDNVKLNLKARAVDSDLTYLTHYPNSYTTPDNPYLDPAQRRIGLYADGSYARMNIFSTDNNVQLDFNTSDNIEHKVLVGVDYSWNRVQKTVGFALEEIKEMLDLYNLRDGQLTQLRIASSSFSWSSLLTVWSSAPCFRDLAISSATLALKASPTLPTRTGLPPMAGTMFLSK